MKRFYWLLTMLLFFSLALAACGGGEAEEPAAPAPAVEEAGDAPAAATQAQAPAAEATAVPTPEPEPTAETVVSFADLNFSGSQENLDSYRYEMVMRITGIDETGEEIDQSVTIQMAFTADPRASSITMISEGQTDMGESGSMEMVQIADTNYMVIPEMGCLAMPAEGEDLLEESMAEELSPENMFGNLENLTLVGSDTINGVAVLHYTFDETAIPAADAQGLQTARGDVYVAKEGGYLVRMVANMQGDSTFLSGTDTLSDAVMHVEFNLRDLNAEFEIVPPEGCEGQGPGAEPQFPVLEDAADLFSMAGMMTYTSAVTAAEAIEFYQNAMAAAGYTYAEDTSFFSDTSAFLNFTSESGAVTISINEDGGVTTVTILAE